MAATGNGTFIPMVSSSPPPMDDITFDDDVDDDDEFSNFSGAPIGLDASPAKWGPTKGSFEPIKSNSTDPFNSTDDAHPGSKDDDFGTFAAFGSAGFNHDNENSSTKLASNNNIGGHSLNGNEGDEEDEFADFAAFQSTPVNVSKTNDGFSESDRKSEEPSKLSSVVLNKNNSHENIESHSTHSPPQRLDKHGNNADATPANLASQGVLSNSTANVGASSYSDLPSSGSKSVQEESGTFSDFQSMIPSQSSLDNEEPTRKLSGNSNDHGVSDDSRKDSDFSVAHLEKPSTGSLSLFQQTDRQTFDSGIDSIMTPSDSSPEGRDDGSVKVLSDDDANEASPGVGPDTGKDGDDWGDFDTFPSADKPSDSRSLPALTTDRMQDSVDSEPPSLSTHNSNDISEFGSLSRTRQQSVDGDTTNKGMLSNPDNIPLSDSGNITNSLSKPQNETPVQYDKDDDDDDDFGDFSNAHKANTDIVIPSRKESDDFDDFGDFESTKSTNDPKTDFQTQDKSDGDWGKFGSNKEPAPATDDDFGDFGAFGSNAGPTTSVASTEESKDDGFGTFSSNVGSSWGKASEESSKDDDFGSFGSSSSVSVSQSASSVIPSGAATFSSKVPPGGRVERLFKSCFPVSMGGAPVVNQPVLVIQDVFRVKVSAATKGKAEKDATSNAVVWESLSDMENTMAQKYHWNNSKNSGKLLRSLGIDSRNILPPGRGGRPLFAQELGMLTPSKPGETSDKAPLGGVSGGGGPGDVSSGAEDSASTTSSVTEDTVPKVEFDWSNSGLINPLDAVQKVDPELLDFAVSPSDPPLQPALAPSSSSSKQSASSSQRKSPNALDEILKHSSSSMVKQKPKREAGLSSEANSVLDSLPDLSYMLAKVLMFPVASSSLSSSSPAKLPKKDAVMGSGWAESIS